MSSIHPNICRLCTAFCPLLVEVEDGTPIKVSGDPSNELFHGYTCPKGRALAEQHSSRGRLLHSLKRDADGTRNRIAPEQAMDEIAAQITAIVEQHGPRSVAMYFGTGTLPYPATMPAARSWLRGIGSPMFFTPGAIDQPGKSIAMALHGGWQAGEQTFEESDTFLLVGMNPVITKCHGLLGQNPGRKIKEANARGMQMIVIDPRRTETAERAALHLRPRPGEDPTLLAAIVRTIIEEQLYDTKFVAENAEGLDQLAEAVRSYSPDYAAQRSGVPAEDIVKAAHIFAEAERGCALAGTGPSFATRGTITEYLCMALNTLCGRWAKAGDQAPRPNVMLPAHNPRAQPIPPFPGWGYGEKMRGRDLAMSAAGMPTAGLTDEILYEGEGRVRVLINVGANPMMSFPDQKRTRAALDKLDLHIAIDNELSATSELADYIIAPMLSFETPGMSHTVEALKYFGFGLGTPRPWAQYAPRIAQPPEGSDVIEDWHFFLGLAQRMNIDMKIMTSFRSGSHTEGAPLFLEIDHADPPTTEDILADMCRSSRVPLDEVKSHPNGKLYDEIDLRVLPREDGNEDRLQLGADYIVEELAKIRAEDYEAERRDGEYPFLLTSRRVNNFLNSIGRTSDMLNRGKGYNPLYVHPDDLAELGVASGDSIALRSSRDTVPAVVEADATMKRGVVAMSQAFGGQPDEDHRYLELGTNTNRLMAADEDHDPITGIPRMGAIPVAIAALEAGVQPV
ncbi:MAG: molybdopterin-dependent oxidoreductase [Novosphingobium sp.]|nr:molybdopterin-dependent oxidoreductase [Novosphingobium sp.]